MMVYQLIAALQRLPRRASIAVVAHDQNDEAGEFDGFVQRVAEAPKAIKERGASVVIYL